MPYFDAIGGKLPTGGQVSLDLNFWTDRLDELAAIVLYRDDDPLTPVELPGLWYGESVRRAWRGERTRIDGADGALLSDRGLAPLEYRLSRLLLSDNTIANPVSGAVGAGVAALKESIGLGGESTCYDQLREIVPIFEAKDAAGARAIWKIESEISDLLRVDRFVFERLAVRIPTASETMLVTLSFIEFTPFELGGTGL